MFNTLTAHWFTTSPDGTLIFASTWKSVGKQSSMSYQIKTNTGAVIWKKKGAYFVDIAIHPNNQSFAAVQTRWKPKSSWRMGETRQYQILAIQDTTLRTIKQSLPMGDQGVFLLKFNKNGDVLEVDGAGYNVKEGSFASVEIPKGRNFCSFQENLCLQISPTRTFLKSVATGKIYNLPDDFEQLADSREFAFSQDGHYFAFKGRVKTEGSGEGNAYKLGMVELPDDF